MAKGKAFKKLVTFLLITGAAVTGYTLIKDNEKVEELISEITEVFGEKEVTAPTNIQLDQDDYIFTWDASENASGYYVEIFETSTGALLSYRDVEGCSMVLEHATVYDKYKIIDIRVSPKNEKGKVIKSKSAKSTFEFVKFEQQYLTRSYEEFYKRLTENLQSRMGGEHTIEKIHSIINNEETGKLEIVYDAYNQYIGRYTYQLTVDAKEIGGKLECETREDFSDFTNRFSTSRFRTGKLDDVKLEDVKIDENSNLMQWLAKAKEAYEKTQQEKAEKEQNQQPVAYEVVLPDGNQFNL